MAGGDQKNVNRHVLSDTHIRNVARYLHVDPIILKPATLTCPWCAQTYVIATYNHLTMKLIMVFRLSGDRKDSLKRHEETACSKNPARAQKASRSYTTHDIPDKVSRQVPIRRAHSLPVASSFQTDQHVHTHSQQPFYNNGQAWASPVTMFHPEPLNPADFM